MSWINWLWGLVVPKVVAKPAPTPGEVALERALAAWAEDIEDAPQDKPGKPVKDARLLRGRGRIDDFIRVSGLAWPNARDQGATRGSYRGDLDFAWCGAFAAHAWAAVLPALRFKRFASTYRLAEWATIEPGIRVKNPNDFRAGDILVVGELPGKPYGKHIALAAGPMEDYEIPTVEGNAFGEGPNSRAMQGVIKRRRKLDEVVHCYRPAAKHLGA